MSVWQYFALDELKCRCGLCDSDGAEMDADFMKSLEELRKEMNFPFVIASAYRCPTHNAKVSSTGEKGPHTTGKAIDIRAQRLDAYKIVTAAPAYGFTGIGVNQKGTGRYIHLDTLRAPEYPRPTIWSY